MNRYPHLVYIFLNKVCVVDKLANFPVFY